MILIKMYLLFFMRLAVHTSDESSKDEIEICTSWNRLLKDDCSLDRAIRFIISKEPTKEEHIEYRRNKRQQKYILMFPPKPAA